MSAETRPPDPRNSYANMAKQNGPDLEDRNVLIVRVRKTQAALNRHFDDSVCEIMCRVIGVKPIQDTIGCQYLMDRGDVVIEIWLKENIQASKFSSDIWREICPGFDIVSVHPALSKEVTLLLLDLPLNVKDKVVREYVAKFGGKLAPQPPQYVKAKSGIWAGQPNGDRKYKVDFSGQIIPMGTYHFLGGRRVRIIYNGNTKTCGRCHQPPDNCPGDGIASKCREKEGPQVYIHEQMKRLDNMLSQVRDNASQAHDGVLEDGQHVRDGNVSTFPPNAPNPTLNSQPEPAIPDGQRVDQSMADISPSASQPVDQSELATTLSTSQTIELPELAITNGVADQSQQDVKQDAPQNQSSAPNSQQEVNIPRLENMAKSEITGSSQLDPKTTGTKNKIPTGLTLTKSQKKKERNRERKRKQRALANVDTEALDTSTEDKLASRMMSWIESSKKQGKKIANEDENSRVDGTGTEADTEQSYDSDTIDENIEVEKNSFHKKILEESSNKSFFEDNPFNIHSTEAYKSVFANRLSLTPRTSKPVSSTSSTPKRTRSPSSDIVGGIKSIRKE